MRRKTQKTRTYIRLQVTDEQHAQLLALATEQHTSMAALFKTGNPTALSIVANTPEQLAHHG